ncbi:MAG: tetratricopeptide repeat protein [Proteobacteria bacterium]|nr:tetratricopeptide repeat protein [Pseudomonadota bacterium]
MPRSQPPDRPDRLSVVSPDDGEAAHLRGVLALQQARLDESVPLLRRAVAAGAGASAMVNLGIALAASGAVEEAENVLCRAVERDDGNPQAAYNLGHLLAARGADREAESWLVKAVSLAPSYTRASCELAALLLRDGRAGEARARLDAALEHDPGHPVVVLHLGLAARALGDHAAACRHFQACRAALGPQRELMLGLGGSLQETGRLDDALAVYRELLVHEPSAYGAVLRALAAGPHGSFDLRPARMRALLGLA